MAGPKTVVITGATRGIGFETARAFLQSPNPYHVLLGARSLASGETAVAQLQSDCPSSAVNTIEVLLIDVESDQSIEAAVGTVKTSRGSVDILINNAGMYNFHTPPHTPHLPMEPQTYSY